MKKHYFLLFFVFSFSIIQAQTNVSGGIYTNTTWTIANSPYVVIDTVVVFPGITLTIEPGVIVKFDDDMMLEIREANLLAEGTATDSITFTSNNINPIPGSWKKILLHNSNTTSNVMRFNYCNFLFAENGIKDELASSDSLFIRNSNFNLNNIALSSSGGMGYAGGKSFIDSTIFQNSTSRGLERLEYAILNHCKISNNPLGVNLYYYCSMYNCLIDSNQAGIDSHMSEINNCTIKYCETGILLSGNNVIQNCVIDSNDLGISTQWIQDTIRNCQIKNNLQKGIEITQSSSASLVITGCDINDNMIGVDIMSQPLTFYCNKICNNISYDLKYSVASGSNISVGNNFWCSNDSIVIGSHIFDGYDNVTYGLVSIFPNDTIGCYLSTGIPLSKNMNLSFEIYPNPTSSSFNFKNNFVYSNSSLQILNPLGEIVYSEKLTGKEEQIIDPHLPPGFYFVMITSEQGRMTAKLVVE